MWKLIGIDFHRRWREGKTRCDLRGDNIIAHHGFFSLEWERLRYVYRPMRAGFFSRY